MSPPLAHPSHPDPGDRSQWIPTPRLSILFIYSRAGGVPSGFLLFATWGDRGKSQEGGLGLGPPSWGGNWGHGDTRGTLTELVVVGDGDGGAGAGALLREVVPEAHEGGTLLQHGGHLHLHRVTQSLALRGHRQPKEEGGDSPVPSPGWPSPPGCPRAARTRCCCAAWP